MSAGLPAASGPGMNYRGDQTGLLGALCGPNRMGEVMTAVSADYDAATDRTHVGFAVGVHGDRARSEVSQLRQALLERRKVPAGFGPAGGAA